LVLAVEGGWGVMAEARRVEVEEEEVVVGI
jgi:hypothetical protein